MMPIKNFFFAVIAMTCFFSFQSCKKNSGSGPGPDPVPVIKPDTLSTGWTKQVLPGETNLSDIFFNSSTTGYLVGSKVYKTTDGGNAWLPVLSNNSLYNIFMTNDNKAFFVGQANTIFKTLDGGGSFVNTGIAATPTDIFFSDNNNGFCIAYDGLYNTVDAGLTWQKVTTSGLPSVGSTYASLSFINNTTGWVVTQNGIYRSAGSSANWQQSVITGGGAYYYISVYAVSASIIYVATNNGGILKSTDGGINFTFIRQLDIIGYTDIHFLNDLQGYASGGRFVYKTTDGGVNWTKVVSLGQGTLGELHFTDANHGWVCGSDGIVLVFK